MLSSAQGEINILENYTVLIPMNTENSIMKKRGSLVKSEIFTKDNKYLL